MSAAAHAPAVREAARLVWSRRAWGAYPGLAENTALGIAILIYNGQLNFGLVADFDALPDVERLAQELRASIRETLGRAR